MLIIKYDKNVDIAAAYNPIYLINDMCIIIFNNADIIDVFAMAFVFFLATYITLINPTTTLNIEPKINIGIIVYPLL